MHIFLLNWLIVYFYLLRTHCYLVNLLSKYIFLTSKSLLWIYLLHFYSYELVSIVFPKRALFTSFKKPYFEIIFCIIFGSMFISMYDFSYTVSIIFVLFLYYFWFYVHINVYILATLDLFQYKSVIYCLFESSYKYIIFFFIVQVCYKSFNFFNIHSFRPNVFMILNNNFKKIPFINILNLAFYEIFIDLRCFFNRLKNYLILNLRIFHPYQIFISK